MFAQGNGFDIPAVLQPVTCSRIDLYVQQDTVPIGDQRSLTWWKRGGQSLSRGGFAGIRGNGGHSVVYKSGIGRADRGCGYRGPRTDLPSQTRTHHDIDIAALGIHPRAA